MKIDSQINYWAHMLDEAMHDENATKSIVIVDVDLMLDKNMLPNYDSRFPIAKSVKHQGGELFIEQIFVLDTKDAEQLIHNNLFYSNFSYKTSIVDIISQSDPIEGHSDGVVRTAQREVSEKLAKTLAQIINNQPIDKIFRFVSPQAYTKNIDAFVSINDGTIIDATKYVKVMNNGNVKALKDDDTGITLTDNVDFRHMIFTQIFGYWQKIDINTMKAIDMAKENKFNFASVSPGNEVETLPSKIQAFIDFIDKRKKFLKSTNQTIQPKASSHEMYVLTNNMQGAYGKIVGEFKTKEEALNAAQEDFAKWISNGWIANNPRIGEAPKAEDLAFDQKQIGIFAPAGKYFRYAPRPGYKGSKISAGWPLNKPIYSLKTVKHKNT